MRKLAPAILAALVFGVIALAQTRGSDGFWRVGTKDTPVRIGGPLYLQADHAGAFDGGQGLTSIAKTTTALNYDFAPITGTHSRCVTAVNTATVTPCRFGDQVLWGADQTIVADLTLHPYLSAANTVSLRACATGITDGGSADMPDASYTFRCIR